MAGSHELTVHDHDRANAGLTYVYPVISRRAGGVSIGINLNPNQACNFRCVYCQVPNLSRGSAPEIDRDRLRAELDGLLDRVVNGDFLETRAPEGARELKDVAISGDGEPTSCRSFDRIVETIGESLHAYDLAGAIKFVLITNGSLIQRSEVLRGLETMKALGGEVWFKIDGGSEARRREVNDAVVREEGLLRNLALASERCRVRVQSCFFAVDGEAPSESECADYLGLLQRARDREIQLAGVLLYGIERPSLQPEAPRLSKLEPAWMERFGARIRALGFEVGVHG
jgi:wyosine [tRNA(Phe)-imidazoG37] synthetase (radical SAM superfamily)